MGIDVGESARAGAQSEELFYKEQNPARRPSEAADVLVQRQLGEAAGLLLPIVLTGQFGRREGEPPCPLRNLVRRDPAQVAVIDARCGLDQIGAAAEHEVLAGKDPARRMMRDVMHEEIEDCARVARKYGARPRDVLAQSARRARGVGIVADEARPAAILKAGELS